MVTVTEMVTVPVIALVYGLVAWINTTGVMPETWPSGPLHVTVGTPADLVADMERCYDTTGVEAPPLEALYQATQEMHAFYCYNRISINSTNTDLRTPAGQTVMVHELVHWLQDYNDTTEDDECRIEAERDAYLVGWLWQDTMGLPRYPDAFTVMMRSQCPPNDGE